MECGTKQKHATREDALEHIKQLAWANHLRGQSHRSAGLRAYPCGQCESWHVGHQTTAPLVWHYTIKRYLAAILDSDELLPAKPRLLSRETRRALSQIERARLAVIQEPKPLLWFSRNTEWEYSVMKCRAKNLAHIDQRNGRAAHEIIGRGLLRFGVPASYAKLRWSDYLSLNPTPSRVRDNMAKRGDPREWLATDEAVSLDAVRAIEVYFRETWRSVDSVGDDEFNDYLAGRAAVYESSVATLNSKLLAAHRSEERILDLTEAETILYQDWKQEGSTSETYLRKVRAV